VNFRWILDYSGGNITDWGGHHPDIAQWGMNTESTGPIEIRNAKGEFAKGKLWNTAISFYFECIYENGVTLIVSNQERGGVTFEGSEGWVWVTRGAIDAHPKSLLESTIGPDEIHLYRSDNHFRNFIDCVLSRKEPIAPIETAHRSITIGHLGNISLRLGRDLKMGPAEGSDRRRRGSQPHAVAPDAASMEDRVRAGTAPPKPEIVGRRKRLPHLAESSTDLWGRRFRLPTD
jgi:hypothetical protein